MHSLRARQLQRLQVGRLHEAQPPSSTLCSCHGGPPGPGAAWLPPAGRPTPAGAVRVPARRCCRRHRQCHRCQPPASAPAGPLAVRLREASRAPARAPLLRPAAGAPPTPAVPGNAPPQGESPLLARSPAVGQPGREVCMQLGGRHAALIHRYNLSSIRASVFPAVGSAAAGPLWRPRAFSARALSTLMSCSCACRLRILSCWSGGMHAMTACQAAIRQALPGPALGPACSSPRQAAGFRCSAAQRAPPNMPPRARCCRAPALAHEFSRVAPTTDPRPAAHAPPPTSNESIIWWNRNSAGPSSLGPSNG